MIGKGRWHHILSGLALCVGPLLGCGDDVDSSNDACTASGAQATPIASNAPRSAVIRARDVWDRTVDETTGQAKDLRSGRLQAGFADLSTVTSSPAVTMPLGEHCFGLVSRPVRRGQATPIFVSEVRVEGTARGPIQATRAGPGTFIANGEPILGDGEGNLRFVVSSTAGPGFDGVDETLAGLRGDVGLTAPDPYAPPGLTTDVYPVRWSAAGADWVEITFTPEQDGVDDGGQVICVVADQGCFDLPVAAAAFLLSGNADGYTMSVELHRYRGVERDAEHVLEVEAVAETRLTVPNGVFE